MASKNLSTLTDGTSQSERNIGSLSPNQVKLDQRDLADLLRFVFELSGQFNYYNFSNQIDGDWSSLLKSDPNLLKILISELDILELSKKYDRIKLITKRAATEDERLFYYNDLLEIAASLGSFLLNTLEEATRLHFQDDTLRDFNVILDKCQIEIEKLRYCYLFSKEEFGDAFKINPEFTMASGSRFTSYTVKDIFGDFMEQTDKINQALLFLDDIFSSLKLKLGHLKGIAEYHLKNTAVLDQQYNPHIGLLISFLHLYSYLQQQLNGFAHKHLDFYYHDILNIKPSPPYPDSVFIIFEAITGFSAIPLPAGTTVFAKTAGEKKPSIYKLTTNQTIDRSEIKELKTIFVSDQPLFSEDPADTSITTTQVYSGDYPCLRPNKQALTSAPISPWPILGEDQNKLAENERSMEDTEIGILVASPLLFLPEGERALKFTFKFEEDSFKNFDLFINHFSKRTGRSREAVITELLSDALRINYSSKGGWQSVTKAEIGVPGSCEIEVSFTLGYKDEGIAVHNMATPGESPKRALPLVRFLINNETAHNPFSFFKGLFLEELKLNVQVRGFRSLKIQNNIGVVSPENPFQLFGPQPSPGTYLNIKNANVFNRFTKDFTLKLDWLNLPKEPGGFKTYYQGYNVPIDNDSFRVRLSALSNSQWIPKQEEQQRFPLFSTLKTGGNTEIPDDTTRINGVDFKKMEWANELSLNQETETETRFREGAIRITFDSPPEGFGHKLFPQIFPEILRHNARRFNKPLPIPEQPFVPIIKALSVDYTLEHSESFKDQATDSESSGCFRLIHQYPFGFDEIYPGSDQSSYSFMPVFNYPSNLYMGISDLTPGTELSLLFKLEEENFHGMDQPNPVHWSYLYKREWVPLNTADLVQDTTNNFMNTGMVRLKIPYLISKGNNSMLNPNLYWLRASTYFKAKIKSRVIAIFTNAAKVTRVQPIGNEDMNELSLPPYSIKDLTKKIPGIQNIWQPFSSFGGRKAEGEALYRTRVSEGLRHKQRPVTIQDIEQFILEKFPDILMVKCITPDKMARSSSRDIDLQIILIPQEETDGQFKNDEPKVNLATLYHVRQMLLPLLSPFIKIEVSNPVYEKVKVVCNVKFQKTTDSDDGFYLQKLNQDIKKYICSWLYDSDALLKIGTTIYLSDIYNYIKSLDYVSVLTGFSLVHFFKIRDQQTGEDKAGITDTAVHKIKFIRGSVPNAVLIPDRHHLITVLHDFSYTEPIETGIGKLSIGDELLVFHHRKDNNDIKIKKEPIKPGARFRFKINQH